MVEEAAVNYSQYFKQIEVAKALQPMSKNIDEMLTRLDEFESLLTLVQNDSSKTMDENFPQLVAFRNDYCKLTKRIDDLEKFVNIVNENLVVVEQGLERAEEELGTPEYSLKGIFKPFFKQSRSDNSIDSSSKGYEQPHIFKTEDFFGNGTNSSDGNLQNNSFRV